MSLFGETQAFHALLECDGTGEVDAAEHLHPADLWTLAKLEALS